MAGSLQETVGVLPPLHSSFPSRAPSPRKGANTLMAEQSPRRSIESWAHDLPVSFVECRTMGHRWQPHSATWDREARAYHVIHACDRCRTQRKAWWTRNGEVTAAGYTYPEGYLTRDVGYVGADGRGVLRTEYLTRMFNTTTRRANANGHGDAAPES
ncbi:hypothetical protein Francci3_2217 [Frankia casuarinae]|uniref:Uncharacterized protein n=2 Tax=Frankiaceae TaxID=74712 RepID=Q2JAV6_FRACC|nr:hypothetical protein Francci3_2217 [Frankia casuarinae]